MDNICKFEKLMNTKGFIRIEREVARTTIPDIETECLRMGKLTYSMLYSRILLVKYRV